MIISKNSEKTVQKSKSNDQNGIVTYLVMPYITDGTLHDRLCNTMKPLRVEESLRYFW